MIKKFSFWLFFLPIFLGALEKQPWLGDVYEFHFLGGFSYSRYRDVQGAIFQRSSPTNVFLLFSDLEFSFTPQWSMDVDLELVETPMQDFGFRSFALQGRYLWLDDIVGDPLSLVTGANIRIVSKESLHDVSCPYHGEVDVEFNFSMGKEFDSFSFWRFRIWGYGALGIANIGSPWLRGKVSFEGNHQDEHKWALFVDGIHGYGKETQINIDHFKGYGRIRQKAIDVGFRYGYQLGVWGTLRAEYVRRVLAKRSPQNVNTFVISYMLPFSF